MRALDCSMSAQSIAFVFGNLFLKPEILLQISPAISFWKLLRRASMFAKISFHIHKHQNGSKTIIFF